MDEEARARKAQDLLRTKLRGLRRSFQAFLEAISGHDVSAGLDHLAHFNVEISELGRLPDGIGQKPIRQRAQRMLGQLLALDLTPMSSEGTLVGECRSTLSTLLEKCAD